jgi:hypothetical protein
MTIRRILCAALACLVPAALSLLLADEPVYDAWAWLAWGRELGQLTLDTSSGPSWKPLPVAIATVLSLAGDAAAPQLWLVLVRAAWLLSLLLAADLALVLAAGRPRGPRIAAAAFAAVGVALLADDVTAWARQAAGGMSEPLLVALVLGAVRAGLADGQAATRTALVLGALAALVRPEAWPLLALYGAWCWRAEPRTRPLATALVLAVPVLWLAPGLLGTGGGAAERAQRGTSNPAEALGRALLLAPAVAWPLALLALRAPATRVLAAGAVAWIALVAAMTAVGFPGLARFMTPAAAIVCVLGGVGLAALLARSRPPRLALAAVLAALVVTAIGLPGRIAELPHTWRSSARISDSHDRLRALARGIGRARLLACGRLATSDVLVRTTLAYELGVPLSQVVSFGAPPRLSGAFITGLQAPPGLRADVAAAATLVAHDDEWRLYSLDCPATASASAARSAGVSGATR